MEGTKVGKTAQRERNLACTFKIVEKRTDFISSLTNVKIFYVSLFVLLPSYLAFGIFLSFYGGLLTVLFASVIVGLKYISLNRYRLNGENDIDITGLLTIKDGFIEIKDERVKVESIVFRFGGVRNASYDGKDVSNGISELIIDHKVVNILVESFEQVQYLRNWFRKLYEGGVELIERDIRSDLRLVELNRDFDWAYFEKISGSKGADSNT